MCNLEYKFNGTPLLLNKWGKVIVSDAEEDIFNQALPDEVINVVKHTLHEKVQGTIDVADDMDNEGCITIQSGRKKTIYLYCRLHSEDIQNAALYFFVNCSWKIWINRQFKFMYDDYYDGLLSFELEKETEIIIRLNTCDVVKMNMRISSYACEMSQCFKSFASNNLKLHYKEYDLVFNHKITNYLTTTGFVAIPFVEKTENQNTLHICIKNSRTGMVIQEMIGEFYKKNVLQLDVNQDEMASFYLMQCSMNDENKTYILCIHKFQSIEELLGYYQTQANIFIEKNKDKDRNIHLKRLLFDLSMANKSKAHNQNLVQILYEINALIYDGKEDAYVDFTQSTRLRNKYYQSQLDENPMFYQILYPEQMTKKCYPLVLILGDDYYHFNLLYYEKYDKEDIIFVNIPDRGITLGNYIFESHFMEVFKKLKDEKIDLDRIYLIGFSNGAYNVWSVLQKYPHYFAGAYLISGEPYIPFIRNIQNIPLFLLSSKTEHLYAKAYEVPLTNLSDSSIVTGIECENFIHASLSIFLYKADIINMILQYKRNRFPLKINHRTDNNFNNQAYWISEIMVDNNRNFAEINATVMPNKNTIHMTTENISGLKITVSHFLCRTNLCIIINGYIHIMDASEEREISLLINEKSFILGDYNATSIQRNIGLGIAGIYLKPLGVILTDMKSEMANNIARILAHPITNGYYPNIYINYPIESINSSAEIRNRKCDYIIIGIQNGRVDAWDKHKKIKTDEMSFHYKNDTYQGSYSVMQIVENIDNPLQLFLFIDTNDEIMNRKNLFARTIILQSYSAGKNLFLNSQGLVFYNRMYYLINKWGDDLKEFNAKN